MKEINGRLRLLLPATLPLVFVLTVHGNRTLEKVPIIVFFENNGGGVGGCELWEARQTQRLQTRRAIGGLMQGKQMTLVLTFKYVYISAALIHSDIHLISGDK